LAKRGTSRLRRARDRSWGDKFLEHNVLETRHFAANSCSPIYKLAKKKSTDENTAASGARRSIGTTRRKIEGRNGIRDPL